MAYRRTNATVPPDPPDDRLGWEAGRWHNESLPSVNATDGLNATELDAVVARAAARIEQIRRLEFDSLPPVEVIDRERFRNRTAVRSGDPRVNVSLQKDVTYEALFAVGETTDGGATARQNRAQGVLGYYSPGAEGVVIVTDRPGAPRLDEVVLAQELFHALQDQRFGFDSIPGYPGRTREAHNAIDGVIEGDGNYVDYLYEQRCGETWACLAPGSATGTGNGTDSNSTATPDRNVALLLVTLAPYSDGPPFVQRVRERGGWAAVNALYEAPPASTEQLIHPKKYPDETPTQVTVPDRSNATWSVPTVPGPNYEAYGEAGLFVMLYYPSYRERSDVIVPIDIFDQPGPELYDYSHPASAGWDGDRLVPYVTDRSNATGETGYVWKIAWDSPADAEEFRAAYVRLLAYHDAERVGRDTYVVPDGPFADAFHVRTRNATTVIVNAPRVEALDAIRSNVTVAAVPSGEANVSTTTPASTTTTAGAPGVTATTPTDAVDPADTSTTTSVFGPGLGPVGAGLALVLGVLVLFVRRRRG